MNYFSNFNFSNEIILNIQITEELAAFLQRKMKANFEVANQR